MDAAARTVGARWKGARMTKQEKIIVSAFTGILMCDFSDVHKYIEEKLGRAVWTHELADKRVWDEIKEKTEKDFLEICKQEETERKKGKWIYNSPVTMKCDQCGFVTKDWDWHRFKFCPNCDCDMRGEEECTKAQ